MYGQLIYGPSKNSVLDCTILENSVLYIEFNNKPMYFNYVRPGKQVFLRGKFVILVIKE